MPRQPLMPARQGAHYYINQECMHDRPEMTAIIAECITVWSQIEVMLSLVLAALLDTRSDAAVAVFLSLQNARAQRAALDSAAGISLTGDDLKLFKAVMRLHKASSGDRNDLAHGIFGVISDRPDEIIWCPSAKFAAWLTRANQKHWNLEFDPDPHAPLREDLFIYKKSDLEEIRARFIVLLNIVNNFHAMMGPIEQAALYARNWLFAQPQMQAELALVGQNSNL